MRLAPRSAALAAALVPLALLGACGHLALTASQTLEVTETGAEAVYVGLATALKSDIALTPSRAASDLALWQKAWADLATVRALYAKGQSFADAYGVLEGDLKSAETATGKTITVPASVPAGAAAAPAAQ